jgi:hypothetical protein
MGINISVTRSIRHVSLVEQELPTLPEHPNSTTVFNKVFNKIRVAQSSVFCVVFCRSLFVPLSFFFWNFYFLSFFPILRIPITSFVSTNISDTP